MRPFSVAITLALSITALGHAAPQIQSLTPSLSSPQPVGATVVWQAVATDTAPGALDYRFGVTTLAAPTGIRLARDFHPTPSFEWTPASHEGAFLIQVVARNRATGETTALSAPFVITPRTTDPPVVSQTNHPLVALFSAARCPATQYMRVWFQRDGATTSDTTPFSACDASHTMNFYIAGLRSSSTYTFRYQVAGPGGVTTGRPVKFSTGALPTGVNFPTRSVSLPVADSSLEDDVILHDYLLESHFPVATDLEGNVLWYYDKVGAPEQDSRFFLRPLPGGAMLLFVNDTTIADPFLSQDQLLREIDLAGNIRRETNITRVNEQLALLGKTPVTSFHHEAVRLANGHTLVLTSTEKMYPAGTQGSASPVDVLGDTILDLDEQFRIVWVWESYDHFDINRRALLRERCLPLQAGCPPFSQASAANDWLHSNSLFPTADGNILVSMRHQDWVIKVNYANGTGNGDILWRLGKDGDFTMDSTDPYPWFSHQHDAGFESPSTTYLSLYDNGNTHRQTNPDAHSRGQILRLDETNHTATLVLNADLGVYSLAVGNGHRLSNGNYHFHSGFLNFLTPPAYSEATEVRPDGSPAYSLHSDSVSYRSYRMRDLYTPPAKY